MFVVTGLEVGGAEMMLFKVLSRIDRQRFEPSLISLSSDATAMLPAFRELGIPCEVLAWRPRREVLAPIRRLARALRKLEPDVVQGWMYHANIAATLAVCGARLRVPVVWNIRANLVDQQHEKRMTRVVIWLSGKLSFSPSVIVNNSEASALEHEQRVGFRAAKRVIVPNGFDTSTFRPSRELRDVFRASIGIDDDRVVLIGLVARYHPVKGHAFFLQAAAIVVRARKTARFVLVGRGIDATNGALAAMIEQYELEGHVHLVGERPDIHAVAPGFDVLVSASTGEGFPNVIGEAMSCGVPCVVTDVGDSAAVIGDTGVKVPPRDPEALAAGIIELIDMGAAGRAELGGRARARAVEKFSLGSVVRQYEELYAGLRGNGRA